MTGIGILLAAAAQEVWGPLPDYTELIASNHSVQLQPGHALRIFALCRFVNRQLQVWAPDGTILEEKTHPQEWKKAQERMEAELSFIPKDPRQRFNPELSLYVLTDEVGGFTAKHTLVSEGFQPSGGGTGKIVAMLRFPKLNPERPFADISLLAAPDEVGMKLFSFDENLAGLPRGIKVQERRVDKDRNVWWHYMVMTGLPSEVTKRWYGLRTDEGNLFERKFPPIGRVGNESEPEKKSLNVCSQPKDNPRRLFHLYVCRTWKLTFPQVRLRPNGWKAD